MADTWAEVLPSQLPEKPEGWSRRMDLHMNFGREGGAASYTVRNPEGELMPISYQYDTRKGGQTGFRLPKVEECMTWAELRIRWPLWLAERSK